MSSSDEPRSDIPGPLPPGAGPPTQEWLDRVYGLADDIRRTRRNARLLAAVVLVVLGGAAFVSQEVGNSPGVATSPDRDDTLVSEDSTTTTSTTAPPVATVPPQIDVAETIPPDTPAPEASSEAPAMVLPAANDDVAEGPCVEHGPPDRAPADVTSENHSLIITPHRTTICAGVGESVEITATVSDADRVNIHPECGWISFGDGGSLDTEGCYRAHCGWQPDQPVPPLTDGPSIEVAVTHAYAAPGTYTVDIRYASTYSTCPHGPGESTGSATIQVIVS